MRQGGILALDLSTSTGWAYGAVDAERPICGVWLLADGGLGRTLASFENELEDAIVLHRPSVLMCEAPLPPTATSNAKVWRQQLGLAALAETTAYRQSVLFREQAASTMRREILGTGRFPRGNAKPAVIAWCANRGWPVPDHNAADAVLVWQYTRQNMPANRGIR